MPCQRAPHLGHLADVQRPGHPQSVRRAGRSAPSWPPTAPPAIRSTSRPLSGSSRWPCRSRSLTRAAPGRICCRKTMPADTPGAVGNPSSFIGMLLTGLQAYELETARPGGSKINRLRHRVARQDPGTTRPMAGLYGLCQPASLTTNLGRSAADTMGPLCYAGYLDGRDRGSSRSPRGRSPERPTVAEANRSPRR